MFSGTLAALLASRQVMGNDVDDSVYDRVQVQRDTSYLFNLESGDDKRIYSVLLDALRAINNADASLLASQETKFVDRERGLYIERDKAESMRPISQAKRF